MEFSDWITKKYIEWRGDAIGRDRTITEFAEYVGVSQQLMTDWMKKGGKKPRSQVAISKLVAIFGSDVYDVLGREPKDPLLTELMALYYSIPDEDREFFVKELVQLAMKMIGAKRIE